jgi:hypothetical protein
MFNLRPTVNLGKMAISKNRVLPSFRGSIVEWRGKGAGIDADGFRENVKVLTGKA